MEGNLLKVLTCFEYVSQRSSGAFDFTRRKFKNESYEPGFVPGGQANKVMPCQNLLPAC